MSRIGVWGFEKVYTERRTTNIAQRFLLSTVICHEHAETSSAQVLKKVFASRKLLFLSAAEPVRKIPPTRKRINAGTGSNLQAWDFEKVSSATSLQILVKRLQRFYHCGCQIGQERSAWMKESL